MVALGALLCETLDLEVLCEVEEAREVVLRHIHLAVVNEAQQTLQFQKPSVSEDDHRMLVGRKVLRETGKISWG